MQISGPLLLSTSLLNYRSEEASAMVRKELQEAETPLLLCGETAAPLTWQSLAVLWWTLSTQPTLAHTQSGPGNHALRYHFSENPIGLKPALSCSAALSIDNLRFLYLPRLLQKVNICFLQSQSTERLLRRCCASPLPKIRLGSMSSNSNKRWRM